MSRRVRSMRVLECRNEFRLCSTKEFNVQISNRSGPSMSVCSIRQYKHRSSWAAIDIDMPFYRRISVSECICLCIYYRKSSSVSRRVYTYRDTVPAICLTTFFSRWEYPLICSNSLLKHGVSSEQKPLDTQATIAS